eukprot:3933708-Rhodomonas_salina.3
MMALLSVTSTPGSSATNVSAGHHIPKHCETKENAHTFLHDTCDHLRASSIELLGAAYMLDEYRASCNTRVDSVPRRTVGPPRSPPPPAHRDGSDAGFQSIIVLHGAPDIAQQMRSTIMGDSPKPLVSARDHHLRSRTLGQYRASRSQKGQLTRRPLR